MRVVWTNHAEARALERQISMPLVDMAVQTAPSMPTFNGDGNMMCWMRFGKELVRIVHKIEEDEIIILTVHEENT